MEHQKNLEKFLRTKEFLFPMENNISHTPRKITNRRLLRALYPAFKEWLDRGDYLWKDFNFLANCVQEFIIKQSLINKRVCERVARLYPDIRKNLNNIDYNQVDTVIAYIIMHFLDRYRRFQLSYLDSIEKGILPVRKLTIDILDVGTGPAPALFAISDILLLLKQFGAENSISRLATIDFECNYVEKSERFRSWLHHFTEFITEKKKKNFHIPFHHGSFYDFSDLDLQREKQLLQQESIRNLVYQDNLSKGEAQLFVDGEIGGWKDMYRYNVVLFGYFITKEQQINELLPQLRSICRALRNGGIIIIMTGGGDRYQRIYEGLREMINDQKYMNVVEFCINLEYHYGDPFGIRLRGFHEEILQHFGQFGVSINDEEFIANLDDKSRKARWGTAIFQKQISYFKKE